jgi:RHS repeat-associated protein
VVSSHTYYPFGAEMSQAAQENPAEAMKFTGHERDIVAGDNHSVDYMHARYYNANLGRFLEVDPAPGDPSSPRSWNRYSYVENSPIGKNDPSGRCSVAAILFAPTLCPTEAFAEYVVDRGKQVREAVRGMGRSASTKENLLGGAAISIVVVDVAANALEPEDAEVVRGGEAAVKAGEEILTRFGTSRESVARLARKAAETEAVNGIHGVSVTARGVESTEVSKATRSAVEKEFKVHDTPSKTDTLHRDIELPKPVTEKVRDAFNAIFGRD